LAEVQKINQDWAGEPCVVAASGPSLTKEVAHQCRMARFRGWRVLAVQDAYRLMPWADALYGCDDRWWRVHEGTTFRGEKWTTHEDGESSGNDKSAIADKYGLTLVRGKAADEFSTDPAVIHYGSNSGFQAVNLAMLRGVSRIVLVGFDMRHVDGKAHFFGDHPGGLHNRTDYRDFIQRFTYAGKFARVPIVNATPGSALTCFPMLSLDEALCEPLPVLQQARA
jgi:hypothetical protein